MIDSTLFFCCVLFIFCFDLRRTNKSMFDWEINIICMRYKFEFWFGGMVRHEFGVVIDQWSAVNIISDRIGALKWAVYLWIILEECRLNSRINKKNTAKFISYYSNVYLYIVLREWLHLIYHKLISYKVLLRPSDSPLFPRVLSLSYFYTYNLIIII